MALMHCQSSWIVGDGFLSANAALSIFLDCSNAALNFLDCWRQEFKCCCCNINFPGLIDRCFSTVGAMSIFLDCLNDALSIFLDYWRQGFECCTQLSWIAVDRSLSATTALSIFLECWRQGFEWCTVNYPGFLKTGV